LLVLRVEFAVFFGAAFALRQLFHFYSENFPAMSINGVKGYLAGGEDLDTNFEVKVDVDEHEEDQDGG